MVKLTAELTLEKTSSVETHRFSGADLHILTKESNTWSQGGKRSTYYGDVTVH
jgi:hypothetical protein